MNTLEKTIPEKTGTYPAYLSFFSTAYIYQQSQNPRNAVYLVQDKQNLSATAISPEDFGDFSSRYSDHFGTIGFLPGLTPEKLGSQDFRETHGTRFAYVIGAMANGIATANMVAAAAKMGCLGFFGAAGLSFDKISENILNIKSRLAPHTCNWGSNLIHAPHEPDLEAKTTEFYLDQNIRRISASAYMQINLNLVYYACKGLFLNPQNKICRQNYIFAKISRPEVAAQFMSPAPNDFLAILVSQKKLTPEEARLAAYIPLALDITVESDSGGHTDNRPLGALFSSIQLLALQLTEKYQYAETFRIGAAGGIGTPAAAAAAFGLGADYILTGSINQSSIESGLSLQGKILLSQTQLSDVAMAPAADMFELGVNVQVSKRRTLFAHRAKKLYDTYQRYNSLAEIPPAEKLNLEKNILGYSVEEVWQKTQDFFTHRDNTQLTKAALNPKHQMALVFRWYLGLSSSWAILGDPERTADYQIWCGPAMGAFNDWIKNSFLEILDNRTIDQIALNLLEGAAVMTRANQLRQCGIRVPPQAFYFLPRLLGGYNG